MTDDVGLSEVLGAVLSEGACIVGMGNSLRGDDGIGIVIAERLKEDKTLPAGTRVLNVEDVLESYVFQIAEGDSRNVLLIDAVKADGEAHGSVVFGELESLESMSGDFSTHKLALSTAGKIFKSYGKNTYLLGIVAANTEFGAEMSGEMLGTAEHLIEMIRAVGSARSGK